MPRLAQVADLLTGDRAAAEAHCRRPCPRVPALGAAGLSPDPLVGARRALTSTYPPQRWPTRQDRRERGAGARGQRRYGARAKEGVEAVWEAVLDLSPRERAVLVWSVFAGLPDGAVARTTAVLPLGVARTVRRALDQVGLTAGVGADYEIAGQPASRDRVAAEVAACFERHHRPGTTASPCLRSFAPPRLASSHDVAEAHQQILAVTAAVIVLGGGAPLCVGGRTSQLSRLSRPSLLRARRPERRRAFRPHRPGHDWSAMVRSPSRSPPTGRGSARLRCRGAGHGHCSRHQGTDGCEPLWTTRRARDRHVRRDRCGACGRARRHDPRVGRRWPTLAVHRCVPSARPLRTVGGGAGGAVGAQRQRCQPRHRDADRPVRTRHPAASPPYPTVSENGWATPPTCL